MLCSHSSEEQADEDKLNEEKLSSESANDKLLISSYDMSINECE